MELPFTYAAASTSTPLSFNRLPLFPSQLPSFSSTNNNNNNNNTPHNGPTTCKTRRKSISVANSFNAFSPANPTNTLSTHWDVEFSHNNLSVPAAPLLPRFEELDTTNKLLRQRIVFLGSQVDDDSADFVISQLLLLDAEDPKKDIRLFINSPGGSVTAGMAIYDAMKLCRADVSTICLGLAASMGAFILASGTKGKRFCMPNGRVMIHQPLGTAGGKATDMMIRVREMSYHKIKINKILSKVTGKSMEQVEMDTDRDNFMNAWEAKEYGLVDGVIDDGKPGLVAPTAEALPPPKTRISEWWKIGENRKAKLNLPSEHKFLQNAHKVGQGSDGDKNPEQPKETPTAV